jgi:hypothetical protein
MGKPDHAGHARVVVVGASADGVEALVTRHADATEWFE